jgi:hypothetical protein
MGSIGDCYDKSVVESLFGTLQLELLDQQRWDTRQQLVLAISTGSNPGTTRVVGTATATGSAPPTTNTDTPPRPEHNNKPVGQTGGTQIVLSAPELRAGVLVLPVPLRSLNPSSGSAGPARDPRGTSQEQPNPHTSVRETVDRSRRWLRRKRPNAGVALLSTEMMVSVMNPSEVQDAVQARLRHHRRRLSPDLWPGFDALMARRGFLSDDPDVFFHPLGQPIVSFPMWVAEAVGDDSPTNRGRLLDLVEATVAGYLYVRVQDDRLDEAIGDPDEALFLADAFLVRHQVLLARHVGSSQRFWALFEQVATDYSAAMLLERSVMRVGSTYGPEEFDRVLRRSHPLVLTGAALLDIADRWEMLEPLRRFVHHAVRAAQLVDVLLDCEVDRAAGRFTWVVRRLDGELGPEAMARAFVTGGLDEIVDEALADIEAAQAAASDAGMTEGRAWLDARRGELHSLRERILVHFLLGYPLGTNVGARGCNHD